MISNTVMIAITEAKSHVQQAMAKDPNLDIEGRLRVAFGVTRDHWATTGEENRFRAGVGGVILASSPEEQERINAELHNLQMVGAAVAGIPVDFSALGVDEEPIGLLRIWREVKDG